MKHYWLKGDELLECDCHAEYAIKWYPAYFTDNERYGKAYADGWCRIGEIDGIEGLVYVDFSPKSFKDKKRLCNLLKENRNEFTEIRIQKVKIFGKDDKLESDYSDFKCFKPDELYSLFEYINEE